ALSISILAGVAGSLAVYYLALFLGRPLVYGFAKKIGVNENSLTKSEVWLSGRGGTLLILIARFTPGIRSSISIPAGVLRMEPFRFFLMTFIGTVGWSLLLILIGYSTGKYWPIAVASASGILFQIILYAVAIASVFYVSLFLSSKLKRN
ncbi:MAG: DedA family protein, partial [Thaumarchaeota archaeon]|nr:DedA family protein [Nitrososphaerota archaeon]